MSLTLLCAVTRTRSENCFAFSEANQGVMMSPSLAALIASTVNRENSGSPLHCLALCVHRQKKRQEARFRLTLAFGCVVICATFLGGTAKDAACDSSQPGRSTTHEWVGGHPDQRRAGWLFRRRRSSLHPFGSGSSWRSGGGLSIAGSGSRETEGSC